MLAACEWRPDNPGHRASRLPALRALFAMGEVARARRRVGEGESRPRQARPAGVRQPAPRRDVDRPATGRRGRAREEPRGLRRRGARRRATADRRRRRAGQSARGGDRRLGPGTRELGHPLRDNPGDTSTPGPWRSSTNCSRGSWTREDGSALICGASASTAAATAPTRSTNSAGLASCETSSPLRASGGAASHRRQAHAATSSERPSTRRRRHREGCALFASGAAEAGPGLLPLPSRRCARLRHRILPRSHIRAAGAEGPRRAKGDGVGAAVFAE
jgi:hypothetical protein